MQTGKQATLAEKQALADKLKNGGYAVQEKKPVVEAEPEPVKPPSPPPSESYISEPRSLTNNFLEPILYEQPQPAPHMAKHLADLPPPPPKPDETYLAEPAPLEIQYPPKPPECTLPKPKLATMMIAPPSLPDEDYLDETLTLKKPAEPAYQVCDDREPAMAIMLDEIVLAEEDFLSEPDSVEKPAAHIVRDVLEDDPDQEGPIKMKLPALEEIKVESNSARNKSAEPSPRFNEPNRLQTP